MGMTMMLYVWWCMVYIILLYGLEREVAVGTYSYYELLDLTGALQALVSHAALSALVTLFSLSRLASPPVQ